MRSRALCLALALSALVVAACDRTAELIPGTATATSTATPTPSPTPTPIVVPTPIVPPGEVGVAGARDEEAALPDAAFAASIVQIVALDEDASRAVRHGSGVVVDGERALILTSFPLVDPFLPDGSEAYTVLAVGYSAEPGDPVILLYEAEIVAAEPDHDLAVLRAVSAYRGEPLDAAEFSPPAVRFGNSAAVQPDEELRLLGYAGQGEVAAASVAPAALIGTRAELGVEGRAWFDLNARLPAGMDGGGAFTAAGGFVGVLVQLRHDEGATLGTARPAALAVPLIEAARAAEPSLRYRPSPQRAAPPAQRADPALRSVVIRGPAFAENALASGGRTSLFDYTRFPEQGLPALYYEFAAQGIRDGSLVEERWVLDGVLQDALSSSYTWTEGDFAVVTDRLIAPNPSGVPPGEWRLEVWVDGSLVADGLAYVGTDPPHAVVEDLTFAATLGPAGEPGAPPDPGASRLLAFFEYEGAGGVLRMHWSVFRDGELVHEAPPERWRGGDSGTWWVGHYQEEPLGAGRWSIAIYFDGEWPPQPTSGSPPASAPRGRRGRGAGGPLPVAALSLDPVGVDPLDRPPVEDGGRVDGALDHSVAQQHPGESLPLLGRGAAYPVLAVRVPEIGLKQEALVIGGGALGEGEGDLDRLSGMLPGPRGAAQRRAQETLHELRIVGHGLLAGEVDHARVGTPNSCGSMTLISTPARRMVSGSLLRKTG